MLGCCIAAIAACKSKPTQSNQTQAQAPAGGATVEIQQGAPLNPADWQCYNVQTEKVCVPKTWHVVDQNQFLLLADLNTLSKGAYFVVLKNNKTMTGYTVNSYLKKAYTDLKNDKDRSLAGYDAIRTSYPDKQMVSAQYHIVSASGLFLTYSTVFEKDNDVYEIALKIRQSDAKLVADRYKEIIFNFYSKGKQMFTAQDQITAIEKIDLSKL